MYGNCNIPAVAIVLIWTWSFAACLPRSTTGTRCLGTTIAQAGGVGVH